MNKRIIFSNLIWRYAERFSAQLVSFIITTILARLLSPETYGIVALVGILITVVQVFVDSGLGNALIQKKEANNVDYSTVFFTNIVFCILLYFVVFFAAVPFSNYYNNPQLIPYIRVLGVTVLISGVKNVQQAYIARNMLFKKFFISTLSGTIVAGICGIWMALNGYGPWALIAQQIINLFIDTVVLWFTIDWKPELSFSFTSLKALYSYGWKLLVSSFINTAYNDLRQLVIGKKYNTDQLAYYNHGNKYPNLIIINLYMSINSVLLPAMSSVQDEIVKVKEMTRKSIQISTYIISPLMIGFIFLAEPFIRFLVTDKWLPSVFFLRIFCLIYMFYPVHSTNLNALKAIGKSGEFLKLEIIKKIIDIILLLSTMRISVKAMALSLLFSNIIELFINGWPNRHFINYSYIEQFCDLLPPIFISALMGVIIYPIQLLKINDFITLLISVPLGAVVYILLSMLFKIKSFYYLVDSLKTIKK